MEVWRVCVGLFTIVEALCDEPTCKKINVNLSHIMNLNIIKWKWAIEFYIDFIPQID